MERDDDLDKCKRGDQPRIREENGIFKSRKKNLIMKKEIIVRRIDDEYLKMDYANKEKILHSLKDSINQWKKMTI